MKKHISIILSSILLVSAITVSAEENNSVAIEDGTMFIDVIESNDFAYGDTADETNINADIISESEETDYDTDIKDEKIQLDSEEDGTEIMSLSANSSADVWETTAAMNIPRADCELLSINDELYSIAGMDSNGYVNTIEKYDETDNSWQIVTEIPNSSKGFGVAAHDSKIYIIGGYNGSEYLNTVQVYDVNTDEWDILTSMTEKRDQPAVLCMDNKLYVFGGRNTVGFVNSYEYYDFSSKVWKKVTTGFSESMIRVGAHAQYIGGYVCVYGGIDTSYSYAGVDMYSSSNLKESQEIIDDGYDGISIAWGADKALIFAWDRENSIYDIHEMAVDEGEISLAEVVFENTSATGKYSKYIIHNGYLYAVGGYNLTSKKYLAAVSKYSVYYGDFAVGAGTINSTVTTDGNSITLNVDAGKEYMLFINAKNITSFDGYTFKLEYTDNIFTIIDGCALTAEKNTSTGAVNGTDIIITENTVNGISFICTEKLSGEEAVTKSVNAILLKANASGQRTITYSMTQKEES